MRLLVSVRQEVLELPPLHGVGHAGVAFAGIACGHEPDGMDCRSCFGGICICVADSLYDGKMVWPL